MYSQRTAIVDVIKDWLGNIRIRALRYLETIQEQRYRIARHKLAYIELSNFYDYFWMSKGHGYNRTTDHINDCYEHPLRDIV